MKLRLINANSRAVAAAGMAWAIAADESIADLAALQALMEEQEAHVVQERNEVDRLADELRRAERKS